MHVLSLPSEVVSWTVANKTVLINELIKHKVAAGDGANFKTTTFHAVEAAL